MPNIPFPYFKNTAINHSALASIANICNFYKNKYDLKNLQAKSDLKDDTVSFNDISDVLNNQGINNLILKVSYDELSQIIPLPCILRIADSHYVTIYKIENEIIYASDPILGLIQYQQKDFINLWLNGNDKNLLIATEENSETQTENYTQQKNIKKSIKKNLIWISLFFLMGCIMSSYFRFNAFFAFHLIYLILSISGLGISVLLLNESMRTDDQSGPRFCKNSGDGSNNCKTVITDKGSIIFNNYSFSDLSFTFFCTTTLLLITGYNWSYFIPIGILSVPLITYTIFYQKFRIGKWCTLCLSTSFLLLCIAANTLFYYYSLPTTAILKSTFIYLGFFGVINWCWVMCKPVLDQYFKSTETNLELSRFKENPTVFKSLLSNSIQIDFKSLEQLEKIEISGLAYNIELKLFLSPNCKYCHDIFKEAYNLYIENKDMVKLSIYFNVNNRKEASFEVADIIMHQYLQYGVETTLQILEEWYIGKKEIEKYSFEKTDTTERIITSHYNWCQNNGLDYSPVILINEYKLPGNYKISDLQRLLHSI